MLRAVTIIVIIYDSNTFGRVFFLLLPIKNANDDVGSLEGIKS